MATSATLAGPPTLPSGTVTFLFTDVEGSTQLLNTHPDAYRAAVRRHHALLLGAVDANGGVVFETLGEGVFAAFRRPTDAVKAALSGQLALSAEEWGETPLRVRMGVHLGEVEVYADGGALRGARYFGLPLVRCGRMMAAAHGGQVVLSEAAEALVRDALPEGAHLLDLGEHRLKDLQRPERVFQLVHPDLPADFPPLRTLRGRPHNLPVQPTPLVGRERELADVRARLRDPEVRLLTLTGLGGTGKTRLALQAAADLLDDFPDGVWLVSLAPLANPALVLPAVVQALGVRETGGQPLEETLAAQLQDKRLLLVLDNFEHVAGAAPLVADLLARAPGVKALVTSRAVLHIAAERDYPVPPLALPDREHPPAPEQLTKYDAVALFVQRAVAGKPDFAVTSENARAVAEICARLDGLPLALELAAARVRVLPPKALLARLGSRLTVLTGGARDLPARQQTLRGALVWSYDLLEPAEQTLFARLGVFVGGCTIEAAEVICGPHTPDGELSVDVLDGLASLTDKSLLRQEAATGEPRFTMLETVREYACEHLAASGAAAATRQRHAAYFLELAERAEPGLDGPEQVAWLDRLELEHPNLRAALRWLLDTGDGQAGLRLAMALWTFWNVRGHVIEAGEWAEALLVLPAAAARSAGRAAALWLRGATAWMRGDPARARAALEESLAIARERGDQWMIARALGLLALCAATQGSSDAAVALGTESVGIWRALGSESHLARALTSLGLLLRDRGELPRARLLIAEGLGRYRALGQASGVAWALAALGSIALTDGDLTGASVHLKESVASGWQARSRELPVTLLHLARVAAGDGRWMRAARLIGASQAVREGLGLSVLPSDVEGRPSLDPLTAEARAHLGEAGFAAVVAEGLALTPKQAVAYALEALPTETTSGPGDRPPGSPPAPAEAPPREAP